MKINEIKKTLYKGDIYIFQAPKGYSFKEGGINYGTVIYTTKLTKGITLEKDEIDT